jgi:acyl-coenzyme A thioesterase PaaI-like protein
MTAESSVGTTRSEAAKALRDLGHLFVDTELDVGVLRRIESVALELAADVSASPRRSRSTDDLEVEAGGGAPVDGGEMDHYPSCPVSGKENPLGLAATVRRQGDDVVATVTFDAGFAGMPGYAHGGPVAAVLDDVMGFVLSSMNGLFGYTASMTVTYKAPVKIGIQVECRGRLVRRDGRKLYIDAELQQPDGRLLATASALFIEVDVATIAASLKA